MRMYYLCNLATIVGGLAIGVNGNWWSILGLILVCIGEYGLGYQKGKGMF